MDKLNNHANILSNLLQLQMIHSLDVHLRQPIEIDHILKSKLIEIAPQLLSLVLLQHSGFLVFRKGEVELHIQLAQMGVLVTDLLDFLG